MHHKQRKSLFLLTCLIFSVILCSCTICSCAKNKSPLLVQKKESVKEISIESKDISLKTYKDEKDISTIIEYLNEAKWKAESVNDVPDEKNYGTISLKMEKETKKIYFYQKNKKNLLESPYIGVYKQTLSVERLVTAIDAR